MEVEKCDLEWRGRFKIHQTWVPRSESVIVLTIVDGAANFRFIKQQKCNCKRLEMIDVSCPFTDASPHLGSSGNGNKARQSITNTQTRNNFPN